MLPVESRGARCGEQRCSLWRAGIFSAVSSEFLCEARSCPVEKFGAVKGGIVVLLRSGLNTQSCCVSRRSLLRLQARHLMRLQARHNRCLVCRRSRELVWRHSRTACSGHCGRERQSHLRLPRISLLHSSSPQKETHCSQHRGCLLATRINSPRHREHLSSPQGASLLFTEYIVLC